MDFKCDIPDWFLQVIGWINDKLLSEQEMNVLFDYVTREQIIRCVEVGTYV